MDAHHECVGFAIRVQTCLCLVLLFSILSVKGAQPSRQEPGMLFLDNGEVCIGMNLTLGGAVTHISSKDHPGNIINSFDYGRQIQMSHYSGPWPFEVGEKKPRPQWAGLGWNPIQTGDCFNRPSKIVEQRNDGKEIYIKCIPMQWPLDNVPGDCIFETWTTLDGPIIHMRYRCTNQRTDTTQYRPCAQELPAVYTISKLWRLMSYTGDKPFTNGELTHVANDWHKPWPWTRFLATEYWAALVGDDDWGIGIFKDRTSEFIGGAYGDGRSDNPKDSSTGHVTPIRWENFDHNIIYEHRTVFFLGSLTDIRKHFNAIATKTLPVWQFTADRQHWRMREATDQGLPLNGMWIIKFGEKKTRLESNVECWLADAAPSIKLELAYKGKPTKISIFWKRLDDDKYDAKKSLSLKIDTDGTFSMYHLDMASFPEYRGLITGMAIEPTTEPRPGEQIAIKSIEISSAKKQVNGK